MNNNRLKLLRKAAGDTIVELAAKTGYSRSAIQRWENNQGLSSFGGYSYNLSELFSCTQDFITGRGDEYIEVYVGKAIDPTCLNIEQWNRISPFVKADYIKRNDTVIIKTKRKQTTLNPSRFIWKISQEDFKAIYGDQMDKAELHALVDKLDPEQVNKAASFIRDYILHK